MKQHPILMSTPMVIATMEDRKTVTRRIVKFPKDYRGGAVFPNGIFGLKYEAQDDAGNEIVNRISSPKQVGDILWVRETWNTLTDFTSKPEYHVMDIDDFVYKAGDVRIDKWRPSIFMPKEAARLWLEVTDVRAERIQGITEADALAEGVQFYDDEVMGRCFKNYMASGKGYGDPNIDYPTVDSAITSFASLWLKINGEKTWDDDVWVWAISYRVLSKTGKPVCNSVGETL